jgi:hypothetical protein
VFWVRNGGQSTPSPADFAAFTHYVGSQFASRIKANVSEQVGWTTTEGLYYGPEGADLGASQSTPELGQLTDAILPVSVACAISWSVQQHYRGGHPRTYVPGMTIGWVASGNTFNAGQIGALADDANSFLSDINAHQVGNFSDAHLGTVSFVLRKEWRDPPVFRDYIPDGATVDARVDTQRRRLGRDIP